MKKVFKQIEIPHTSIIINNFSSFDYFDNYKIIDNSNKSIDEVVSLVFQTPRWVSLLLKVRDFILIPFGYKSTTNSITISPYYDIGDKAVFFTVVDRNENEIVMEEKDKHLDFRTSVLIANENETNVVYMSTLVKYNNKMGKIYFFIIKPFHKVIVKIMLKNLCIQKSN